MDPKSIDLKSIRNGYQQPLFPPSSSSSSIEGRSYSLTSSEDSKLAETGQNILKNAPEGSSIEKKERRAVLLRQNSESIIQKAIVPAENIIVENSFGRYESIHELSEKIRPQGQKKHILHFIEGKAFIHVENIEEEKKINNTNRTVKIGGKIFKLKAKKIAPSLYKKLQIVLHKSMEQHLALQEAEEHLGERKQSKKIETEKNQIRARKVFSIKKTEKIILSETATETSSFLEIDPIKIKEEISNAAFAIEENREEKRKKMKEESVNRIEKSEKQKQALKEKNLKENLNQTFKAEMGIA